MRRWLWRGDGGGMCMGMSSIIIIALVTTTSCQSSSVVLFFVGFGGGGTDHIVLFFVPVHCKVGHGHLDVTLVVTGLCWWRCWSTKECRGRGHGPRGTGGGRGGGLEHGSGRLLRPSRESQLCGGK